MTLYLRLHLTLIDSYFTLLYQAPCSFQHVILGNHVLFVPMTIIR